MLRHIVILCTYILIFAGVQHPLSAKSVKIATWNIEHLHAEDGAGPVARGHDDFVALKVLASNMDADIIALQEIENREAAERIFPASDYEIFLSNRPNQQRVGFAVRKSISVSEESDFVELGLDGNLRYGKEIVIEMFGKEVHLLAIHLKSGCFIQPIETANSACEELSEQIPVLEGWIDARFQADEPFIVLGDFNRRLSEDGGEVFDDLNDNSPEGLKLDAINIDRHSSCRGGIFPDFIDYIVIDDSLSSFVVPSSFREMDVSSNLASDFRVSDHCAISVELAQADEPDPSSLSIVSERLEELQRELKQLRARIGETP